MTHTSPEQHCDLRWSIARRRRRLGRDACSVLQLREACCAGRLGRHVRRGRVLCRAHAPREPVSRWHALGLARGGRGLRQLRAHVVHFRLGLQARLGGQNWASASGPSCPWARRRCFQETSDVAAAAALAAGFVLLLLPIQVHPPGGKQGLTAVLGSLAWAGVRRLLFRPPDAR